MATVQAINGIERIVIGNEAIVRPLSIGTSWRSITIGILYAFDGPLGQPITGNPEIVFGLQSGTVNHYHLDTTSNFVGMRTILPSWGWNTNGYWTGGTANTWQLFKKAGTAITNLSTVSTLNYFRDHNIGFGCHFLRIQKPNPGQTNYTMFAFRISSLGTYITVPEFNRMSQATFINWPNTSSFSTVNPSAGTINEEDHGNLDTLYIGWNKNDVLMHLAAYNIWGNEIE